MQEVEGSTPNRGTCPNHFSDPTDQDIHTQYTLSWKIVVSEWQSVTAVSLNVRSGACFIKPAKLYICTRTHYIHDEDGRTAPCVCEPHILLSHLRNIVTRTGLHSHTQTSGPRCSKLTTSLVNETLKFQTLISQICQYFFMKKCEKLLQCKSFSHFYNKKYQ